MHKSLFFLGFLPSPKFIAKCGKYDSRRTAGKDGCDANDSAAPKRRAALRNPWIAVLSSQF
jgi:hypothetical protein